MVATRLMYTILDYHNINCNALHLIGFTHDGVMLLTLLPHDHRIDKAMDSIQVFLSRLTMSCSLCASSLSLCVVASVVS